MRPETVDYFILVWAGRFRKDSQQSHRVCQMLMRFRLMCSTVFRISQLWCVPGEQVETGMD